MQCIQCNKDFESKRSTARYCSPGCRKLAFQSGEVSVPENGKVSVPEVSVPHPDRDNIYSRHFDISEEGFIRRNKAWLDASGFKGTPKEQAEARKINRAQLMVDNIRINKEHVANAVSEAERRSRHEAAMEAIRKIEG